MLEKDKIREAIQFLRDNLGESLVTAACACNVKNEDTVRKALQREEEDGHWESAIGRPEQDPSS
jgi:hypothetical protein